MILSYIFINITFLPYIYIFFNVYFNLTINLNFMLHNDEINEYKAYNIKNRDTTFKYG